MKKLCYITLLFFLCNCSKEHLGAVPEVTLNTIQTFGGSKNDVINSIVATNDGGYAVLGYTQSNNFDIVNKSNESFDFWVMKFSSEDQILWNRTFGGSDDDRGVDIVATNDGGFAILGAASSSDLEVSQNAGSHDFWMLKITAEGTVMWEKSFGFSGSDKGISLTNTADNGFLLTGVLDVSASGGQGNSKGTQRHSGGDVWVLKLSSNGTLEWSTYFGGSFTDTPFGVVETSNNEYIIAASSDSEDFNISNNKGTYDFWVFRITSEGTLVWEKNFGGSEIDEARAIAAADDGNFIIVGDTRSADVDVSNNNGAADIWVLKISPEGILIWEKTIGATGFDAARSISKMQDNGFLISGSSRSSTAGFINQGQNDAFLFKINSEGIMEWQETVGGSEIDFLYDAVELNNRTIIAVGESNSADGDIAENKGFSDGLIIKIK